MKLNARRLIGIGAAACGLAMAGSVVMTHAQQQTAAAPARGQQPVVNSEIFLAPLDAANKIGAPVNISNSPDYDNQPSFTPDGKSILFTSKRDGKQTDIYRYDLATTAVTHLTHTAESEYSPLVTPDGKTFSVIRVEADGTTQRLWRFDLDGSNPRLVLENIKPVGYQCWIDATNVAIYVLGAGRTDPSTLQIVDTATGVSKTVDSAVGHTLIVDPKSRRVTYAKKGADGKWVIQQVDPVSGKRYSALFPALVSEDFALESNGGVYLSHGTVISRDDHPDFLSEDLSERDIGGVRFGPWPAADFANGPFKNITRMTISPDGKWIAFVAEPVIK
jgi:dipeptidyl aminopeptidase/acylaminoacyl peptidase